MPKIKSDEKFHHLQEFNKKLLGNKDYDVTAAALGEIFYSSLTTCNDVLFERPAWHSTMPTRTQLFRRTTFGKPDLNHSFAQEACFETTLLHTLCSGFLTPADTVSLFTVHPLIGHLASAKVTYSSYDFRWINEYDQRWETQTEINLLRQDAMTACLLHYNLDTSLLMRYVGNNYTGAYREVDKVVNKLRYLKIDETLIDKYVRVMVTGCPNHFVAETTRANALLHWRMRNGPTIAKKLDQVLKTMTKEDKNNFVIPIPHWLARFIPNLFFTPQHILEKPGKKDRQIFDASKRYTPSSVPINFMTSTPQGSEEQCLFGNVREDLYRRIYNLRITYPGTDIVVHANDVKSAFRQIKLHPDIMGAFSYIIADKLFLSCGLPFGTDFSPANWEVVRQLIEAVAERIFPDDTLRIKHAKYLKQLNFDRCLGKPARYPFTRAVPDGFNHGVRDDAGNDADTPHHTYVDDDIYAEIWDRVRIEQAVAASIEAIFLLLGYSELDKRQDPISFDKMIEMAVAPINCILGHIVDTRHLTVSTPREFIAEVLKSLLTTWGEHRRRFFISEAEVLTGKLGHISIAAPWLRYLMTHIYCSLAYALKLANWELIRSNAAFRQALRTMKQTPPTPAGSKVKSFYQAETARQTHRSRRQFRIPNTLRRELHLVTRALMDSSVSKACPIGHLIARTPIAHGFSDSSLRAAGGYCASLNFWWYLQWEDAIRLRTLLHLKNNNSGQFIDINCLEYAGILITFIGICHRLRETNALATDPNPVVLCSGDNAVSESWSKKASKHSPIGRALGRLQCATMINNPVALLTDHVSSEENVVADKISRIESELDLPTKFPHIAQEHATLTGCHRFVPSSAVVSWVTAALLHQDCKDPLTLSKLVQTDPGKTIF